MLLDVQSLTCTRGGLPILAAVDFRLSAGQVLLLRGPNGSGKTTLLRTIAGLQPPLVGQVVAAPDSIAYGGHADGLKATLSVAENLEFWAGVYGTSDINNALQAFDIMNLRDRLAQNLSAGQKRRLGLARLLVTGRAIWALDEPTVSLDVASVALFAEAVRAHAAAGGAALIATHIDLGFDAQDLDVSQFRASATTGAATGPAAFDEAFL